MEYGVLQKRSIMNLLLTKCLWRGRAFPRLLDFFAERSPMHGLYARLESIRERDGPPPEFLISTNCHHAVLYLIGV
jgi:hypothetical protein